MADVPIKPEDQERIDAMVAQYRHSLEALYAVAYLQGQIQQSADDLARVRGRAA